MRAKITPGANHPVGWFRRPGIVVLILGVGMLAAVNFYLAGRSIGLILAGAPAVDWEQLVDAARRAETGGLYEVTDQYSFPYSPLLAYAVSGLSWIGAVGWRLVHIVAAFALPTWPMRALALVSWPFWYDVETGNLLIFIVVAAAWAIRGNRIAAGSYLLLMLLVPRPLMLPVAIWVLWKRPAWRLPFLGLVIIYLAAVTATGWGDDWVAFLSGLATQFDSPNNLGPTRVLGAAWLLVALPLGAFLTWRGRLGLASLATSYPYVLPYYLLMLVLEMPGSRGARMKEWSIMSIDRSADPPT